MSLASAYDRVCATAYGLAKSWVAPAVRNSQYAYRDALRTALEGHGGWLDVGCGHGPLPSWMDPRDRALPLSRWTTVGIDLDAQSIRRHPDLRWRLVGNIETLPFKSGTFDLVTANMVVEHVRDPASLFSELGRVLAPGGRLIVHTPNASGYTTVLTKLIPESLVTPLATLLLNRESEDVYPTFYRVNTREALLAAADTGKLLLSSLAFVNSSPQFFRVPPAMVLELTAMRLMERPRWERFRACIIATFDKAEAGTSA